MISLILFAILFLSCAILSALHLSQYMVKVLDRLADYINKRKMSPDLNAAAKIKSDSVNEKNSIQNPNKIKDSFCFSPPYVEGVIPCEMTCQTCGGAGVYKLIVHTWSDGTQIIQTTPCPECLGDSKETGVFNPEC